MLPIEPPNRILADNVNELLARQPRKLSRPETAALMQIGDKTLGFIKAGTGNPTLESISLVARYLRRQPWELLKPAASDTTELFDDLVRMATPRSKEALNTIARAAEEGRLTDDDLRLLQHIAERFMQG
jgi:hypothetical protein